MKKFLIVSLVVSSFFASSANALLLDDGGSICYREECLLSATILPTYLIANDMSQADASEFLRAEAQNFVDGVDGDYLLLKATAKAMNKSVDAVATDLLK